jgi:hypothetical protein
MSNCCKISSLQIDYEPSFNLGKTVKLSMPTISTGVTAMGVAHLAAGTAAALPIVGCILIGFGLATFLGGVAYVLYKAGKGTYHKLINSTDAVLDLAIKEVLQWQCSTTDKDNSREAVSKEKKLQLLGKYENLT